MTKPMSARMMRALTEQPKNCADCGAVGTGSLCELCQQARADAEALAEAKRKRAEDEAYVALTKAGLSFAVWADGHHEPIRQAKRRRRSR